MSSRLTDLIDKQDNFEIIRDQIAAILAVEVANQKVLAIADGQDPNDYNFSVYVEKTRPFEVLTDNTDGSEIGETPLVNVLFDNDTFDNKGSDVTYRQSTKGIFYIDCYAHSSRTSTMHGDEASSKESDRIARLVRNIIMSAEYYQLGLGWAEYGTGQNIVKKRYIMKREKFFPQDREGNVFENVIATRLTLEVEYNEFNPQIETRDLELLYTQCTKSEDGQVLFEAETDYTE